MSKLRFLIPILVFVIITVAGAFIFTDIVIYFTIALVISSLMRGLVDYINQWYILGFKVSRILSVIGSFLVFSILLASMVFLLAPIIKDQFQFITSLNYEDIINKVSEPIAYIQNLFKSFRIEVDIIAYVKHIFENQALSKASEFIPKNLGLIFTYTGNIFTGILAVLFITFLLLMERNLFNTSLIRLIPNRYFEVSMFVLGKISILLSRYLRGLLIQMTCIFTIISSGLLLLGIDYAISISLFAAIANIIPFVGPLIGLIFGFIVTIPSIEVLNFTTALVPFAKLIAVFLTAQIIDNIFLQPVIFSKSVKAHPLEIFTVIFCGAILLGAVGMIMAIPIYTILKVVVVELQRAYIRYKVFSPQ